MKVVTILESKCLRTSLHSLVWYSTRRNIPVAPTFNTKGSIKGLTKRVSYKTMGHIICTEQPNWSFPKCDNIDLAQFLQGSRKAIETTSKSISQCNYSRLNGLVSAHCMDKLRSNVFEVYSPAEISLLAIKEGDIFFQFIENAKVSQDLAQIDLVSFSLNNLAECKINTNRVKNFQGKIQADLQKKGGVLKREDFDASEYRKITDNFEDLNPGSLVRENEVHITNYQFEKFGDQDWQISAIGHLSTANNWNWLQRFKWKGRVHISIHFDKPFIRVLRYDYLIDLAWILILIYLQILALIIGSNIEKAELENARHRNPSFTIS